MKPFSSISLDSSKLLPVKAAFSSTGTYFSANPLFRLVKTSFSGISIFLFRFFFRANRKYYSSLGEVKF